ncbi:MAG: lipocalin family protein [Bacteroidota bacterium]|nr:lipocalin family protein [Bacteroidota bacterium]
MKTIYQSTLGTIAILIFLINTGCSKGGDSSTTPTPTTSKVTLLTSSDWGIAGIQHKAVSASVWTDDYAGLTACVKDNKVVYRANGTYESNEGATKCNPSDPQILETGTWSLTTNETILVVQATNGNQIYNATIETLTTNSLIISFTKVDASNVTQQYKYSFSH